ncbi:hypothetical protein LL14B4_01345 [Lactococcus lactis subsp. lactis]|uniref:Uncharacterized protein n=1 Tax=Lactococcus lactis subsp. lactis TaxID=1360 RepID=A0A2Z3KGC0_LACLL|nr:hypothetical protein LL14B4_01345 [Lactococcus lactis subsp. lactis]
MLKELGLNKEYFVIVLLILSVVNSRTVYNLWGTPVTDNPNEHKFEIFTIIMLIISVLVMLIVSIYLILKEFV